MINKLKQKFKRYEIDGYIIPKNDEFFSEYANPNRLKIVSNFSGSAGMALILKDKNYLFVDGRYTLQAKLESGKKFKICEITKVKPKQILSKFKNKLKIGFDPKLFTNQSLKKQFLPQCNLIAINDNLVDRLSITKKLNGQKFYQLNSKDVGETTRSKISRLLNHMSKKKIDNIFISAPENVSWLLNLRGYDNPNSPIPNCRLILSKSRELYLFSSKYKILNIKDKIPLKVNFYEENDFYFVINKLKGINFSIDEISCSIYFEKLISSKFYINTKVDPCYYFKSIKNVIELNNMEKAHIEDGVALTKFLYWIKNSDVKKLDELKVEKKLENFRKRNKNYLYPSFNTIAGSGPNGAIIHYRANKKSNRKIRSSDIFLCDSGGQYKYGTTDVTRTICFEKPKKRIKDIFTRVLKGHIAVVSANLNKVNKGNELDAKARYWLNKKKLDYGHGTGHGVGYFLNVHEGPQSLSKYNNTKIENGMVVSNEPGYYEENRFGIRIENLIYAKKDRNKFYFKNLTLAPIDSDLIDFNLLNFKEKKYLKDYHHFSLRKLSKFLTMNERNWLRSLI